jgi:hypothetical protein
MFKSKSDKYSSMKNLDSSTYIRFMVSNHHIHIWGQFSECLDLEQATIWHSMWMQNI